MSMSQQPQPLSHLQSKAAIFIRVTTQVLFQIYIKLPADHDGVQDQADRPPSAF